MTAKVNAKIGGIPVTLEVLKTPEDRARGYQFTSKPPGDSEGMLFCMDRPDKHSFHMKNVIFDLDALTFDSAGVFLGGGRMKANSEYGYSTPFHTLYVVELRGGWITSHLEDDRKREDILLEL